MNRYSCEMVQDLLPLYEDGCCSEESKTVVEAHLAECSQCRQAHEEMRLPFMGSAVTLDDTPEQTLKNGMRKVRAFLRRSLTITVAMMIAAVALLLVWQLGSDFFNQSYEIEYQNNCYFLDISGGTLTVTGQSTFTIVGQGSSKRFSDEMGAFRGHVEVAAYPTVSFKQFSCMVDNDLVQLTNQGVHLMTPDAAYWYWIFISPDDPDVCMIYIHNLLDNSAVYAVCGDSEEEAQVNYQKYQEAYRAMVKSGKQ